MSHGAVLAGGLTQHLREAIAVFEPLAPETNTYLELEEAKSTLELEVSNADMYLTTALTAASRSIDEMTGTRFYTTVADEIRYYTPVTQHVVVIDDLNTLTEIATSPSGTATYSKVWAADTDYVLEPLNAVADGEPWKQIQACVPDGQLLLPLRRSLSG